MSAHAVLESSLDRVLAASPVRDGANEEDAQFGIVPVVKRAPSAKKALLRKKSSSEAVGIVPLIASPETSNPV